MCKLVPYPGCWTKNWYAASGAHTEVSREMSWGVRQELKVETENETLPCHGEQVYEVSNMDYTGAINRN